MTNTLWQSAILCATIGMLGPAAIAQSTPPTAYRAVPLQGPMPPISPADGAMDMTWTTIDGGGGPLSGAGGLLLEGTVGQPDAGDMASGNTVLQGGYWGFSEDTAPCYANCDGSTIAPILNVNDFQCFLNRYVTGDPYANCDGSTIPPVLNINDFQCFLNRYAQGCP